MMNKSIFWVKDWVSTNKLNSKSFTCGYCNHSLASDIGYAAYDSDGNVQIAWLYICHQCSNATYIDAAGSQAPSPAYGESVNNINDSSIEGLYDEARNCFKVDAYTASVLCSRKLLMNIAVSKGAAEGKKFIEYVEFLSDKGYVPPDGKEWVDHIRKKGNEATHEIKIMKKGDAEDLINFIEMLLKFIFEFPAMMKKKADGPS